eukprot:m.21751 g.21751  ORF g.21751 m.21751 type:complete len:399 (-) comp5727_c0_seq1:1043-2239(-)
MAAAGAEAPVELEVTGTGLGGLPDQHHAAASEKGFEFNVMIAGETGLGKSTFLNAMFAADVHTIKPYGEDYRVTPTAETMTQSFTLTEDEVQLRVSLIDTPGFGTELDNTRCWVPLKAELEGRLKDYMNAEAKVERETSWPDLRVHCLLYFISPTGHGLKALDVAVLRELQPFAKVVPLIGKGDLLTTAEQKAFRARVAAELREAGIRFYEFPCAEDDEAGNPAPPFCVSAGSGSAAPFGGTREYPWGVHDPADPTQSDAAAVRRLLIGTHLTSLIHGTHTQVYESYRATALATTSGGERGATPLADFDDLKQGHSQKRDAIQADMEEAFRRTQADHEKELRDLESVLLEEHETLQRELLVLKREVEDKTKQFEAEKVLAEVKPAPPPTNKKTKRLFK